MKLFFLNNHYFLVILLFELLNIKCKREIVRQNYGFLTLLFLVNDDNQSKFSDRSARDNINQMNQTYSTRSITNFIGEQKIAIFEDYLELRVEYH